MSMQKELLTIAEKKALVITWIIYLSIVLLAAWYGYTVNNDIGYSDAEFCQIFRDC